MTLEIFKAGRIFWEPREGSAQTAALKTGNLDTFHMALDLSPTVEKVMASGPYSRNAVQPAGPEIQTQEPVSYGDPHELNDSEITRPQW